MALLSVSFSPPPLHLHHSHSHSSLSTTPCHPHSQLRLTLQRPKQQQQSSAAASNSNSNSKPPSNSNSNSIEQQQQEDEQAPHANDPGVRVALSLLRSYQQHISPLLPRSCRYVPTCSQYSIQAFQNYGLAKGSILTVHRICRCNPFGGYGFDPPRWFGEEREEPSDL